MFYPWLWFWAGSVVAMLGHSEQPAGSAGFPWIAAAAFSTWEAAVFGLERIFVDHGRRVAPA